MNANSPKMNLEEKLVQLIKDNHLSSLIDDEDAMTDLVRRSIHEVLFKSTTIKDGYNTKTQDSLVIEAARVHAKTLVGKITTELFDNEESRKLIRNLVIDMLPQAIQDYLDENIRSLIQRTSTASVKQLQTLKNNGQF